MNSNYFGNTLNDLVFLKGICDTDEKLARFKPSLEEFEKAVLEERAKFKAPFGDQSGR